MSQVFLIHYINDAAFVCLFVFHYLHPKKVEKTLRALKEQIVVFLVVINSFC